jgi:type IV fimbrial biogenesis protein FimT
MGFKKHVSRGITLVELVTVVAIVGITLSLAAPAFSRLLARDSMVSSVNLLLTHLHLARSSAVTRERHITLCPAAGTSACSNDHRAWHDGYLVFEDNNQNQELNDGEQILRYQERAGRNITIVSSSEERNRITYQAMGRAWFSNTTIRLCHANYPELNRAVIISNNGRVRVVDKLDDKAFDCQ